MEIKFFGERSGLDCKNLVGHILTTQETKEPTRNETEKEKRERKEWKYNITKTPHYCIKNPFNEFRDRDPYKDTNKGKE